MANAKSGLEWNLDDLKAFNIKLVKQNDAATFFGVQQLPEPPTVEPGFLEVTPYNWKGTHSELIMHMRLACASPPDELEGSLTDFTFLLLRALGYADYPRTIRSRQKHPFWVRGEPTFARPNITISNWETGFSNLLVQGIQTDRETSPPPNPGATVVAGAIAAFANDDYCYRNLRGGLDAKEKNDIRHRHGSHRSDFLQDPRD